MRAVVQNMAHDGAARRGLAVGHGPRYGVDGDGGGAQHEGVLDPIEGILAVLDRASSTGTNKFGLLLALIELAPTVGADRGLSFETLAATLIALHWEHVTPFRASAPRQVTSQNRELTVLRVVRALRATLPPEKAHWPFVRARAQLSSQAWADAVAAVARDTARNPIALLQTLDRVQHAFLYTVEGRVVRLNPGVAETLTRFGPVLRELVEARFVQHVVTANPAWRREAIEPQLRAHLFGATREMPGAAMRKAMAEMQDGRCLYTGRPLRDDAPVDHVLPWARVRVSTLGNFLMTDRQTNTRKRDLLLGEAPLTRWLAHLDARRSGLDALARAHDWPFERDAVVQRALALYRGLAPGAVLWSAEGSHTATAADLRALCERLEAA
ncbi:MAG: hypothetical protein JNK72_23555 [Myxococcales bacterium]|nr:hypothetical protein [Myxococcales bacterium]